MDLRIDFATTQLESTFRSDHLLEPLLKGVVLELALWASTQNGAAMAKMMPPVVTSLVRTEKEQAKLNPAAPRSFHLPSPLGAAVDLRTVIGPHEYWPPTQLRRIVGHLRDTWGAALAEVIIHDGRDGFAPHLHVAVKRTKDTLPEIP